MIWIGVRIYLIVILVIYYMAQNRKFPKIGRKHQAEVINGKIEHFRNLFHLTTGEKCGDSRVRSRKLRSKCNAQIQLKLQLLPFFLGCIT